MELKEFGGCVVLFRGALGARLGVSLMGGPARKNMNLFLALREGFEASRIR